MFVKDGFVTESMEAAVTLAERVEQCDSAACSALSSPVSLSLRTDEVRPSCFFTLP